MLTSLLPIRDPRDRVIGYAVSACPADGGRGGSNPDQDARRLVEMVGTLTRMAGRSLLVPVTASVVRDGAITRFASADAVWLLATETLDDVATRRSVERLIGAGFHFALQGFPDGDPLPSALIGSTIVLDAADMPLTMLEPRVRTLLDAGLRPMVRGVDDRFTRQIVIDAGVLLYSGRMLARGASTRVDPTTEESVVRALDMLAAFADGRPTDSSFDAFVQEDVHLAASLLKTMGSASLGVRGPRSVAHAITVLGRDAIMDRFVSVTARLIGDAARDAELGFAALRRARMCEQVGAALDSAPHPRARVVAGLLSTIEFALGASAPILSERTTLPPVLRDSMTDRQLPLGQLLEVIDALEYGWWADFLSRCERIGIAPAVVADAWITSWRAARDELGMARNDLS